jgi:hypothetical protein
MKEIFESSTFWIFATLAVILLGWAQHLRFSFKLDILRHRLKLVETDLKIAREIIGRHPEDGVDYANQVLAAIEKMDEK